jgi:hypothetical protein
MASNGAKTPKLPFFWQLEDSSLSLIPNMGHIHTLTQRQIADNFKLSKAPNGELWTTWQERVVSEIEM